MSLVEAKVSKILPFTPHLPLLPCLAITELVLMKEMSYLDFLFNAIQQNHSSFLLHAGLGPLLHCTGHTVVEMLVQEGLFAVLDKREGRICSCHCCYLWSRELKPHIAICVHAVPIVILRIHVQDWSRSSRNNCVFCQAGRVHYTIPQDGEGITEDVVW